MHQFKVLSIISEGQSSTVYRAIDRSTLEAVAIKRLKRAFKSSADCLGCPEMQVLQHVRHHNVIRLKQLIRAGETAYLVFELMDGDLMTLISIVPAVRVAESEIRNFFKGSWRCTLLGLSIGI